MRATTLAAVMLAAVTILVGGRVARAEEGMFTFESAAALPIDAMHKAGIAMSAEDLLAMRSAVALVASGGTGSFVSADGLLVTNHHVAYKCLTALDGTEAHKGVMDKGHLAATREDELACPNYDMMVVEDVRDVTAQVEAAIKPGMKGHRRFEAIRRAMEELEAACQKDGAYCDADALDGGRLYHMMVYKLIRDVRLVYAPEQDLGKFGGDVDNWRFPRHTADFTFLRAYVDPTGAGAAYSDKNVPYKPRAFIPVTADGVKKGDGVVVLGFPARTRRHFPGASARFAANVDMPTRRAIYDGLLAVIQKVGAADELTKRRYQGLDASLNNASKYMADVSASFQKWGVVDKFDARDDTVDAGLVRKIDGVYARWERVFPKFVFLQRLAWVARSVGTAFDIAMWTEMRVKPDGDRNEEDYQDKNMFKTVGKSDVLDEQITLLAEKALLDHIVREAQKLKGAQRIKAIDGLLRYGKTEARKVAKEAKKAGEPYDTYYEKLIGAKPSRDPVTTAIDLVYARTSLLAHSAAAEEMDRALYARKRLFYNDVKVAKRFRDPLLDFGRALAKEYLRLRNGAYRGIEETFDSELRPEFVKAIGATYPDANFQLRLSYGAIDDYTSSDDGKTYRYVTDLAGLLAKVTGEEPFRIPDALKVAAAGDKGRFVDAEIGDVPVNLTATLDTTGGNSGSPIVDGKGRLVGLLFDGTPESQLSDWQFLAGKQRSILLDIRYALFLADKVHGAAALLEELGLNP
jgi:hypothetical protein